ncbi:hypothetical protein ACFSKW_38255 [Nonomuraea mangrovi]|uniref:Glycosyl hydrolase family 92 N-terminal domain-containing protein n=1 Tax=Nonomuraea mangrovi TaxID=2316207 RepID=A0ABW4T7V0_9ACTN
MDGHQYYYSVDLLNGIRTEIAPADHSAVLRFTFPDGQSTARGGKA